MAAEARYIKLVDDITGLNEINRLISEIEALDDFLHQASIRKPGTKVELPQTGRLLDQLAQINNLNLLQTEDRQFLRDYLKFISQKAPVVHMSFTLDPTPLFRQKLVAWLRQNIHPQLMVQVGLHPNIGAGCVLRTTNKYFDLSLRQRFFDQRELLLNSLKTDQPEKKVKAS